ncbi:MAG TPA: hypothetical protein VGL10_01520 [Gammaproteobacteria bacterium]
MTQKPVKLSKTELLQHLKEQFGFLARSCTAYDAQYRDEGKRIAVVLRTLLHDTNKSKSLLGLLGLKQSIAFLDTALPLNPKNLLSHAGLTMMRVTEKAAEYVPCLDENPTGRPRRKIFFPEWWNAVVIVDQNKNKFNRRELILAVANKDGGAHVDPTLDAAYAALTRNNSMGWIFQKGEIQEPLLPIELASIRQIGHEVISTLKHKMPKVLA